MQRNSEEETMLLAADFARNRRCDYKKIGKRDGHVKDVFTQTSNTDVDNSITTFYTQSFGKQTIVMIALTSALLLQTLDSLLYFFSYGGSLTDFYLKFVLKLCCFLVQLTTLCILGFMFREVYSDIKVERRYRTMNQIFSVCTSLVCALVLLELVSLIKF